MIHRFHRTIRAAPALRASAPALLLACACVSPDRAAGVVRRDSAGVTIVASARAAWGDGQRWSVDSAASRDLADSGDVRVAEVRGAVRLRDGSIVVANGGTRAPLIIDSRGRVLHVQADTSRSASPDTIGVSDEDGFWAWDGSELRLSNFDSHGRSTRSRAFPADSIGVFPRLRGVFADGSLLLSIQSGSVFSVSPRPQRDTLTLLRYTFAPARLDTLLVGRGAETFTSGDSSATLRQPAPFGRNTFVATHGNELWIGDSERFELRVYDRAGHPLRIVRWPGEPRRITPAERDSAVRAFLRRARGSLGPDAARALAARLPFPATFPAFAALLVDREGNAWLQDGDPARTTRWTVIHRDGALLGTVELAPGLHPLDIGTDYVLGRWTSPGGAAHVRLHRLRR